MDDEIVTLASFSDPFEAAHVKGLLEDEGIRVIQSGEQANGLFPGIGGGVFGRVELLVSEKDLKRATFVLSHAGEEGEDEEDEDEGRVAERSEAITGEASAPKRETEASDAIQAKPRTKWAAVTEGPADEPDEADEVEAVEDERSARSTPAQFVKAVVGILLVLVAIVVLIALISTSSP